MWRVNEVSIGVEGLYIVELMDPKRFLYKRGEDLGSLVFIEVLEVQGVSSS